MILDIPALAVVLTGGVAAIGDATPTSPSGETIKYVCSAIGGGILVAVGNWIHASRAAQVKDELSLLRDQLNLLYGPVFFFTHMNEQLLGLSGGIQNAYTREFVDKKWSDHPVTQATVSQQAAATIDLANAYVRQVVENNKKIVGILAENWHLVDAEDIQDFSQFQVDCTRLATEVDAKMGVNTGGLANRALGGISFMRPAVIRRVEERVQEKQSSIRGLLRPWWRLRARISAARG
jgi:hypothetical protein